ncbi:MAG: hypothetical protein B7Z68_06875 [Acidobacteria bacterium 21-70-11]|nr:MAG: hypothetical protein B7Z68_06875 [Acidobacteria bacterium 21-70-11]OYW06879.1 MAG: hypothetical protein B7Z61_00900 [Acidobacteria bacterium 37-71-11]HQT93082.1 hypothetical protein [Thermoanaerobaculaceae bacterium]HQU34623.1 hypothetical protein [Thermoanaerobaculaceae bacterium]
MKTVLVATLLTALAAPAVLAAPPTAADLLRRVPQDATVVVAIDSAALRAHPAVHGWLIRQHALTGAHGDVRRFLDDAGLDPLRDVDVMVVAAVPEGGDTTGVALFAGRYDTAALATALLKRGAQAFSLAGVPAYRLASEHESGRPAVVALPSAGLVVVGDEATVALALAPPHSAPPLASDEVSAGRLDTRAPFWLVATIPAQARGRAGAAAERVHGEGAETVRGVMFASGTVRRVVAQATLDGTLAFSGAAIADTPENAELLRDTVKGALAAARLHFQDSAPELVDVLRAVNLRLDGPVVAANGAIPVALIEKLAAGHGCTATGERRHP